METVDAAALRAIVGGGHSKCPKVFYYLEFGILMFRHVMMIKRIGYHHHILTRDDKEIIKKVYLKQKETPIKGDWIETIKKDYEFIGESWDDEKIRSVPKEVFMKNITHKVTKAAFQFYLLLQEKCKKKLESLKYEDLQMQEYLINSSFNTAEIKLLISLRSKCYPSKMNFKKLNKGNLKCIFNCNQVETQTHVFENCEPIVSKLGYSHTEQLKSIYGTHTEQKSAIKVFLEIDIIRQQMIDDLLPGEDFARTQDTFICNRL